MSVYTRIERRKFILSMEPSELKIGFGESRPELSIRILLSSPNIASSNSIELIRLHSYQTGRSIRPSVLSITSTMATLTSTRPTTASSSSTAQFKPRTPGGTKRKKPGDQRPEIWSSLLRQTCEAQARNRSWQNLQSRDLILCGGSAEDQQVFVERCVARPPPAQVVAPSARKRDGSRVVEKKGEVRLSNGFAYGYGHVTLFSPPAQQGAGMLGNEAEEVGKVEVHTFPEPEAGYEKVLRRLLKEKRERQVVGSTEGGVGEEGKEDQDEGRRPGVSILLSWKEPWVFLDKLRRWLYLLSSAILPSESSRARSSPESVETLRAHDLKLTVILQHTEAQESLLRESVPYTEESFDLISQTLRTCLLPLSAGLVYTSSLAAPQPPGAPLSEAQKVIYTSLRLDIGALQPKQRPSSSSGAGGASVKKDELMLPKHNVVDRMAVLVPSGWDSVGKIRLLSEDFSPEAVLEGWMADLSTSPFVAVKERPMDGMQDDEDKHTDSAPRRNGESEEREELQANGAAEYDHYSPQPAHVLSSTPPLSPSKSTPRSAIATYEHAIQDPNAHKKPAPPSIDVTTKPEQQFLAEMRAALQSYEEHDRERAKRDPTSFGVSTTAGRGRNSGGGATAPAESEGALRELGNVSFNVGGVSYDTISAEAAIERLKRPAQPLPSATSSQDASSSPMVATPRASTPRPPRRDGSKESAAATPVSTSGKDIPVDKLEAYFHSLMKRGGGGGGSVSSTPSKAPQQ